MKESDNLATKLQELKILDKTYNELKDNILKDWINLVAEKYPSMKFIIESFNDSSMAEQYPLHYSNKFIRIGGCYVHTKLLFFVNQEHLISGQFDEYDIMDEKTFYNCVGKQWKEYICLKKQFEGE